MVKVTNGNGLFLCNESRKMVFSIMSYAGSGAVTPDSLGDWHTPLLVQDHRLGAVTPDSLGDWHRSDFIHYLAWGAVTPDSLGDWHFI